MASMGEEIHGNKRHIKATTIITFSTKLVNRSGRLLRLMTWIFCTPRSGEELLTKLKSGGSNQAITSINNELISVVKMANLIG